MKYPVMKYVRSDLENVLHLHLFDGTYREVTFSSVEDVESALRDGRAGLDCTAVVNGLLPRNAILVSRAIALSAENVLKEMEEDAFQRQTDPMAPIRLRFSQKLLVDRSQCITVTSDAVVRQEHPRRAVLYHTLIHDLADRSVD